MKKRLCVVCKTACNSRVGGICSDCRETILATDDTNTLSCCVFCMKEVRHRNILQGDNIGGVTCNGTGDIVIICRDCWRPELANKVKTIENRSCSKCLEQFKPNYNDKYSNINKCKSCIENYFNCSNCGREKKSIEKQLVNFEDGRGEQCFCRNCYRNVHTCTYCENTFYNPDRSPDCCPTCRDKKRKVIRDYSYKPKPIFYPLSIEAKKKGSEQVYERELSTIKENKTLFMGIELEVLHKEHNEIKRYDIGEKICALSEEFLYLKSDSSINGCRKNVGCKGFEIVSHPAILDYHRGFVWKDIFEMLVSNNFLSHNTTSCGLHIHVNKSFLSFGDNLCGEKETDKIKLAAFISSQSDKIIKFSRRYDGYAKIKVIEDKKVREVANMGRGALNFGPTNSFEFRLFKGTLRYETFMATLQFVDALCRFIKTVSIAVVGNPNKCWFLFCKYIEENKYKELYNYLKLKKLFVSQETIKRNSKVVKFFKDAKIVGKHGGYLERETYNARNTEEAS